MKKAVFEGLVYDSEMRPLQTSWVGSDPCYVIDDDGFMRHVSAETIDRQVWDAITRGIEGNEDFLSQQAAEMMGQDDPFSIAVIRSQFENTDEQFSKLQEAGFPEDARMYLGMVGFQVIVNYRGELIEIKQPTTIADDE